MELEEILGKFQGERMEHCQLSTYQQWAMQRFHDETLVANPYLSMTIELDLQKARQTYEHFFKQVSGASFQCYLVWNLLKALQKEWVFSIRKIGDQWYYFKNLPTYFPIALGGDARFRGVFLENTCGLGWEDFARVYRQSINSAKVENVGKDYIFWAISNYIGNLPYLNFTAFQVHRSVQRFGRPVFYFGQRQQRGMNYTVPLSICLDHANTDPFVTDSLLKIFYEFLVQPNWHAQSL